MEKPLGITDPALLQLVMEFIEQLPNELPKEPGTQLPTVSQGDIEKMRKVVKGEIDPLKIELRPLGILRPLTIALLRALPVAYKPNPPSSPQQSTDACKSLIEPVSQPTRGPSRASPAITGSSSSNTGPSHVSPRPPKELKKKVDVPVSRIKTEKTHPRN